MQHCQLPFSNCCCFTCRVLPTVQLPPTKLSVKLVFILTGVLNSGDGDVLMFVKSQLAAMKETTTLKCAMVVCCVPVLPRDIPGCPVPSCSAMRCVLTCCVPVLSCAALACHVLSCAFPPRVELTRPDL